MIDREHWQRACEIHDVEKAKHAITNLLIATGIMEASLKGTLPWGMMNQRERKAWLSNVENAAAMVDDARKMALIAARTAFHEGDS